MLSKRWNQKGRVIVMSETTDEPLTLAGFCAGFCWGADTSNNEANRKRGLECLRNGHGRALEFAQVYLLLDGWSARVIREFGRHVGGLPTYLQASTRYIDYSEFNYIIPHTIENNPEAKDAYEGLMDEIRMTAGYLEKDLGIKKEDAGMVLPLGMETKIVYRTNLRALIDMAKVRMCSRAYWEYRELMKEICDALAIYSDEWEFLICEEKVLKPKCEHTGFCDERYSCGRKMKKEKFDKYIELADYMHKHQMDFEDLGITLEEE